MWRSGASIVKNAGHEYCEHTRSTPAPILTFPDRIDGALIVKNILSTECYYLQQTSQFLLESSSNLGLMHGCLTWILSSESWVPFKRNAKISIFVSSSGWRWKKSLNCNTMALSDFDSFCQCTAYTLTLSSICPISTRFWIPTGGGSGCGP